MIFPPAILTFAAMLFSFVPGLPSAADSAAAQMADRPAYAMRVLDEMSIVAPTAKSRETTFASAISGFIPVAGAIVIALAALFCDRVPFRIPTFTLKAVNLLRRLHSRRVGDYVVWLTLGVGGLGVLLAFPMT